MPWPWLNSDCSDRRRQGISTQHTLSTTLPTTVPGWLPGRRRTTPLTPLGDGHRGPDFRRAVGSRSKASRGPDQPAATSTLPTTVGAQVPRYASQNTWAGAQMQLRGVVGFSCPPRHPDTSQTSLPGQVGPCSSILFAFSCIPIGSAHHRYLGSVPRYFAHPRSTMQRVSSYQPSLRIKLHP